MKTGTSSTLTALMASALFTLPCSGFAEIAVIVNPANQTSMTNEEISMLYLGKAKRFPNGASAVPIDREEGSDVRAQFVDKALGKSESQIKSYWSRLIFSGKGMPPKIAESDGEVKELVARNPDIIGYIDSASIDDSVKVLAKY